MRQSKLLVSVSLAALAAMSVSACAPLIVGGAATAGYLYAQEREVGTAVSDLKIKTHIKDRLTNLSYHYLTDVDVTVLQGDVLLTGVVKSPKASREIEQAIKDIAGINAIYNELLSDGVYAKSQIAEDTWIANRVRAKLLSTKDIYSINYMVSVVRGHVYLTGIASSLSEKERVLHVTRTIKGVKQVHDYVRVVRPVQKTSTQQDLASPNPLN